MPSTWFWIITALTWAMIGYGLIANRRTARTMRRTDKLHAETVRMYIDAMREVIQAPMIAHSEGKVIVELDGELYTRIASMIAVDDMIEDLKP